MAKPLPASYAVRELRSSDLLLFRSLLSCFAAAFEEEETYLSAQPSDAYLDDLLSSESFLAVVAEHGGAVVGGLAGYELRKFEQERKEIYIYDLAVDACHRRQGIATALLRQVKKIAGERGVSVVFVQADRGDEPAIALYESFGKREDVHHFDI